MRKIGSIIKQDVSHLLRYHWKKLLGVGILVGFLLFLLNIFVGLSTYTYTFSGELKSRLGMYFYIKESPDVTEKTYKNIINLQNELQKQGLKTMFSSKEDAMKFLSNKLPDISENFEKFGIENPLPATLYVMFSSNKEYESLKKTILKYKDIILNIKDLSQNDNIKEQENRILNIININNFITFFSIIIIIFLSLVIFTFLAYQTNFLFQYLKKDIEVKNLLGGSFFDIIKEFMIINTSTIVIGFVLCFLMLLISRSILSVSIYEAFNIGLLDIFAQANLGYLMLFFLLEVLLFILFSIIFSSFIVRKMKR